MKTKQVHLTLTDTRGPKDQQEPTEYLVEMPADYDPELVTFDDVIFDGAITIINERA